MTKFFDTFVIALKWPEPTIGAMWDIYTDEATRRKYEPPAYIAARCVEILLLIIGLYASVWIGEWLGGLRIVLRLARPWLVPLAMSLASWLVTALFFALATFQIKGGFPKLYDPAKTGLLLFGVAIIPLIGLSFLTRSLVLLITSFS